MRLIDADALEKSLTEKGDDYKVSMFATSDDCNIARIVAFECAEEVKNAPTVEAVPVVRCKDCVYFRERHVRMADGTERDYTSGEESVTADVGINVGSQCRKEEEPCFREGGDFCSRGVRRSEDGQD